ncbi:MAG: hypothetical protein RML10_06300 [Geminocystis sp.]|nr:hypothetical protein [Geminocystis sp.]
MPVNAYSFVITSNNQGDKQPMIVIGMPLPDKTQQRGIITSIQNEVGKWLLQLISKSHSYPNNFPFVFL